MENDVDMETLCEGMKEMLFNQTLGKVTLNGLQTQEFTGTTLANNVKTLIESALSDDIEKEIYQISDLNSKTFETCVDNITKILMNSPRMMCVQENINNLIETCSQELITEYPSHHFDNLNLVESIKFNETDLQNDNDKIRSNNFTPILQPFQYIEIAHNILPQKPLYIRAQAFNILLSSQLTDAITSVHWPVLQKSLQSVLSDDNFDIFQNCIQIHSKLMTSTSPEGIKESFLNILESLCQHYYTQKLECNEINVQISPHYRIVKLCDLMLDCIKNIIPNLPRFGEKRLVEMIDNFMHLISIHNTSDKTCLGLTILDVVSCLDPEANWFKYLSHNAMSRKIIFLNMSQNCCLLRIIIGEIIDWFNNPVFAEEDVLNGNLNKKSCKFAKFIHCLSLISKICTFDTGRNLFPVTLSKDEEPVKIQKITGMILKFLNKQQIIEEQLEIVFSDNFIKFMINSVENLMSYKDISNHNILNLLQILFEPLSEKPELPAQHTVLILKSLCDHTEGPQNYFFKFGLNNNKKRNLLINIDNSQSIHEQNNLSSSTNFITHENRQNKELRINNIERQIMTMKSTIDSFTYYSFCPIKIITNVVITLLKTKELRDMTVTAKLINICSKLFQIHEGILILESNKSQLINNASIIYQELIDITKQDGGCKILEERNIYLLFSAIENFIIMTSTTPLGFYLTHEEQNIISECFLQVLQQPKINWEDSRWRLFVMFASNNDNCAQVINKESKNILKDILLNLWSTLDDNFIINDSMVEIDEAVNNLMICVSTFGVSLKGIKAIFDDINITNDEMENDDGKSEETLTELIESYPETITSLILNNALVNNTLNYKVHEIALTVFNVIISNIDNVIYLQNKLQFQDKLLKLQSDNRISENLPSSSASNSSSTSVSDIVIIDECSLLRHEILEKVNFLGPNNCSIDYNKIDNNNCKLYYTLPSFTSSQLKPKTRPRTHGELSKFLQETRNGLHDINWLKQARKAYRGGNNDDIKCTLLTDLVEQVQRALNNGSTVDNSEGFKWATIEVAETIELFPEEYIGIQLTVRYGIQHRLLQMQSMAQSTENLAQLLKLTKATLFNDQRQPKQFNGFDWFLATVYLVCCGNVEKCQNLLSLIVTFPSTVFVWDQYALSIGHSNAFFGHALETVIKCELPFVFHCLRENGMSWWLLCNQWIRECFWRVFDWNQICHWLIFCILHPPDYIVYFCTSILQHIEQRVLEDSNSGKLWKLLTCPPEKYLVPDHLPFMDKLWRRHHSAVTPYLETCP